MGAHQNWGAKLLPTLAEDARAGLPALRLVYLGGGSSPHFSGCDLAVSGGRL
jgi:hypothetical protein